MWQNYRQHSKLAVYWWLWWTGDVDCQTLTHLIEPAHTNWFNAKQISKLVQVNLLQSDIHSVIIILSFSILSYPRGGGRSDDAFSGNESMPLSVFFFFSFLEKKSISLWVSFTATVPSWSDCLQVLACKMPHVPNGLEHYI